MLRNVIPMLFCLLLFCGCAAETAAPLPAPSPLPTPSPAATVSAVPGMEAALAAHVWQDAYDESFYLEFDPIQGTMTEHNRVLGSKSVYRIGVDDERMVLVAENGGERKEIPFCLAEGMLTVDYGGTVGEIFYRPAGENP